MPWIYVINNLNGKEIDGTFYQKEWQKTNQEEFRIEKVIKEKEINYISNGKVMMRHLIVGLNKKTLYKMSQYFLLNHMNFLEETSVSKWICLIMQQKQI